MLAIYIENTNPIGWLKKHLFSIYKFFTVRKLPVSKYVTYSLAQSQLEVCITNFKILILILNRKSSYTVYGNSLNYQWLFLVFCKYNIRTERRSNSLLIKELWSSKSMYSLGASIPHKSFSDFARSLSKGLKY